MAATNIIRKELIVASVGTRTLTEVDAREIIFEPGQSTGRHRHPCPVVGYIVEGDAILQIGDQPPQLLPKGAAFYEPADALISRFDNASSTAPMKFVAFYLLNGKQDLITMLGSSEP